ncbi:MAG: CdaR family protein [Thermodesulfobacteriota bacterium]
MTGWLASLGRNKSLKFLSLLLALALWFAVGGEERTETTLNLPLEVINLSPEMVITSEVPSGLQVRVMGPRSLIRSLSQSRLVHTLNLAGAKGGEHSFPLGPNSFSFPRGVQVTRVQPNPLSLTLSPKLTRTLPIHPVLVGNLPKGYEVKSIKTRPEKVTVKGPAQELAGLKAIDTLPIDLTNLTSSITLATDVDFGNLHLSLQEQVPILADLTIAPKIITRKLNGVPVSPVPQPARLSPPRVTLTLQGPWRQINDLKPEDIKATVDTQDLTAGRHRLKVDIQLPQGINLQRLEPETVTARLVKAK